MKMVFAPLKELERADLLSVFPAALLAPPSSDGVSAPQTQAL